MKSSILKLGLLPAAILAAIILPDTYIYDRFASTWWPRWIGVAYWIPSILIMCSLIAAAVMFTRSRCSEVFHNVGVIILSSLSVVLPKIGFVVTLTTLESLGLGRVSLYVAFAVAAALLFTLIYGATAGKARFKVRSVEIDAKGLPKEFDGYRIVQLSDIHAGSWHGNSAGLAKAVEIVNSLNPDMVAFTGDLVNSDADEVDEFIPILSNIRAADGVYSVLGNHDYGTYSRLATTNGVFGHVSSIRERHHMLGWELLNNENRMITRGGEKIAIVGVENSGNPPFPCRGDLKQAMSDTDGLYKILLSHDPTHWRREVLPSSDVQLMLAGHTHDMQFSIFGHSPASKVYAEHNGLYTSDDGRNLFVNIGLGHLFPLRLGAWPEITLITLRRS
ncbi:MAG: metallophosphoesterase [Lachnoclostridium sp.]|nr:metallophosphoesterase [Lachnoclostridium sp.]